ncbi:clan AA aspartic protease [Ignisphaera sp. 4213-co]|uniref:Clan AA aspartic protease n=1 Tax=Ignisphaera cupida TaxID=3050454 RepID=A0ABD4Z741_9CREN|nr:clan AA aspartic protease [Ignisphaera sp. 4213-co]MDK6028757.1 clan AA aspartic protease [Ignisphaera sp. 4213-co]
MGLAFVDVELNGVKLRALVDTGFNGDVLVSSKIAKELNLPVIGESSRKTVDNRIIKTLVSYGKLKLLDSEGYVIIEIIEEMPLDVLIGVRALEALGFVVDTTTGTLRKIGLIAV